MRPKPSKSKTAITATQDSKREIDFSIFDRLDFAYNCLNNAFRQKILNLLKVAQPVTTLMLATLLNTEAPEMLKDLDMLRQCEFVQRKKGNGNYAYYLNENKLESFMKVMKRISDLQEKQAKKPYDDLLSSMCHN